MKQVKIIMNKMRGMSWRSLAKLLLRRVDNGIALMRARRAVRSASRGLRTPRLVVFISDWPRVREAKLAHGLKLLGWKVVLLYMQEPLFDWRLYFNEAIRYRNAGDAVRLSTRYRPIVYHVFSLTNYKTVAAFLRYRPGKVVCDPYDSVGGFFSEGYLERNPGLMKQIRLERFCFENADGLCCRNLETQFAKRELGYNLPRKRIFFPEYCWEINPRVSKLSDTDGTLHVVYGGSIWLEEQYPNADFGFSWFVWLAKVLAEHGIHFHLYPGHGIWQDRFETAFAGENKATAMYLHLHKPVPMSEWVTEIAQYDVGVNIYRSLLEGRTPPQYTIHQPRLMYSNGAIADFLDAGVYLLTNADIFVSWLANRLGFGINVTLKDLQSKEFWAGLLEKVTTNHAIFSEARTRWSIRQNAPRLAAFYESVAANHNLE